MAKYYLETRSLWPEMKRWAKDIRNKDRVLDVGCGEGRLLQSLKVSVDYTGIDFSEKLIKIARERYGGKNRRFITGDITTNDVWRSLKKFDKIFLVAVLHHLPTRKEQLFVLRKTREHLKPGEKIYLSVWNLWQKKFLGEHFKSLKLKLGKLPESLRWVEVPLRGTKLNRFYFAGGRRYWKKLLKEAGWKKVKVSYDKGKKNIWAVLGYEW